MQDNSKLRGYARQYHNEISELLRRMPRALLLLLKASDCLRSIDVVLGRPLNTIAITARACCKASMEGDSAAARALTDVSGDGKCGNERCRPSGCSTQLNIQCFAF